MEQRFLKHIYQVKQETYNQLLNEGLTENNLYFVRDFDENGNPISTSIYLGDRLYGQTGNITITGNDVNGVIEEVNKESTNTSSSNEYTYPSAQPSNIPEMANYEEYYNVINNGGEIELEQDIINTQTIIE